MPFPISAKLTIKNGYLAKAVQVVGSQKKLAEELNVCYQTLCRWCQMKDCPPLSPTQHWSQERLDEVEKKLFRFCNATLEEIFPPEIQLRARRKLSNTFLRELEIEPQTLERIGTEFTDRLTLPSPSDELEAKDQSELIEQALNVLSVRQKQVMKLRFGIGGAGPYSYEEVGKILRLTSTRIRQLEAQAIFKLRTHAYRIPVLSEETPAHLEAERKQ